MRERCAGAVAIMDLALQMGLPSSRLPGFILGVFEWDDKELGLDASSTPSFDIVEDRTPGCRSGK